MASSTMVNVGSDFDMTNFVNRLAESYQAKGFNVTAANLGGGASIVFDKDTGGVNTILGLGKGITANCMLNNGTLNVSYTNEDLTSKIVGLCVTPLLFVIPILGWIALVVRLVMGIVGLVGQLQLPKEISGEIRMLAGGGVPGMPTAFVAQPTIPQQTNAAPVASASPAQANTTMPVAQPAPASNGTQVTIEETAWSCQCGANGNTGAFCSQCGSPRP